MSKFDVDSPNCIVIMYPTGGYGNFLYYLLSEHLESTVKSKSELWEFSSNGHSHQYPKHVEEFQLGLCVANKNVKEFAYNYNILNSTAQEQIQQGKKFLVLADVGNTGDNIKFLKRYFPKATIIRTFAESFDEKLIVWTNCMTKLNLPLYPGSIMPKIGVAQWANKSIEHIDDNDAVDCMLNFFQTDFDKFGKFFNKPVDNAINVPITSFFNKKSIHKMLGMIAQDLDTQVIVSLDHEQKIEQFLNAQTQLSLLEPDSSSFPLVRQALAKYENTK
jgi:hypothetical protein